MPQAIATVADFEIEEHVADNNSFFQLSSLTLDDLDVYAKPYTDVLGALNKLARGAVTDLDAFTAFKAAAKDLHDINAAIEQREEQNETVA
jgi:hypothetical protein